MYNSFFEKVFLKQNISKEFLTIFATRIYIFGEKQIIYRREISGGFKKSEQCGV